MPSRTQSDLSVPQVAPYRQQFDVNKELSLLAQISSALNAGTRRGGGGGGGSRLSDEERARREEEKALKEAQKAAEKEAAAEKKEADRLDKIQRESGDWFTDPVTGRRVWVEGRTADVRKHNLPTALDADRKAYQADAMKIVEDNKELSEKIALLKDPNTSAKKAGEMMPSIRNEIAKVAKQANLPGEMLIPAILGDAAESIARRQRDIANTGYGDILWDTTKMSFGRWFDSVKDVFSSADETLRRAQIRTEDEQRITEANPFLAERQRRRAEGEDVFDRMSGREFAATVGEQAGEMVPTLAAMLPVGRAASLGARALGWGARAVQGAGLAGSMVGGAASNLGTVYTGLADQIAGEVAQGNMTAAEGEQALDAAKAPSLALGGAAGATVLPMAQPLGRLLGRGAARLGVNLPLSGNRALAQTYRQSLRHLSRPTEEAVAKAAEEDMAKQATRGIASRYFLGGLPAAAIEGAGLGAAINTGTNAVYNYGTGQDRDLATGNWEAISNAVTAAPLFGLMMMPHRPQAPAKVTEAGKNAIVGSQPPGTPAPASGGAAPAAGGAAPAAGGGGGNGGAVPAAGGGGGNGGAAPASGGAAPTAGGEAPRLILKNKTTGIDPDSVTPDSLATFQRLTRLKLANTEMTTKQYRSLVDNWAQNGATIADLVDLRHILETRLAAKNVDKHFEPSQRNAMQATIDHLNEVIKARQVLAHQQSIDKVFVGSAGEAWSKLTHYDPNSGKSYAQHVRETLRDLTDEQRTQLENMVTDVVGSDNTVAVQLYRNRDMGSPGATLHHRNLVDETIRQLTDQEYIDGLDAADAAAAAAGATENVEGTDEGGAAGAAPRNPASDGAESPDTEGGAAGSSVVAAESPDGGAPSNEVGRADGTGGDGSSENPVAPKASGGQGAAGSGAGGGNGGPGAGSATTGDAGAGAGAGTPDAAGRERQGGAAPKSGGRGKRKPGAGGVKVTKTEDGGTTTGKTKKISTEPEDQGVRPDDGHSAASDLAADQKPAKTPGKTRQLSKAQKQKEKKAAQKQERRAAKAAAKAAAKVAAGETVPGRTATVNAAIATPSSADNTPASMPRRGGAGESSENVAPGRIWFDDSGDAHYEFTEEENRERRRISDEQKTAGEPDLIADSNGDLYVIRGRGLDFAIGDLGQKLVNISSPTTERAGGRPLMIGMGSEIEPSPYGHRDVSDDFQEPRNRYKTNVTVNLDRGPLKGSGPETDSAVSAPSVFYHIKNLGQFAAQTNEWMKANGYSAQQRYARLKALAAFGDLFQHFKKPLTEQLSGPGIGKITMFRIPGDKMKWPTRGPQRGNMDVTYGISIDFSTNCAKRVQAANTARLVEMQLGRPLDQDHQILITTLMRCAGKEAPCAYCYVESKRRTGSGFVRNAMNLMFAPESELKRPENWSDQRWNMVLAARKHIAEHGLLDPYDAKNANADSDKIVHFEYVTEPTLETFNKYDLALKQHPEVYKFLSHEYQNNQANTVKIYEEYNGELQLLPRANVERLNGQAGVRFFSSSDFQIEHVVDVAQALFDCQTIGAKSHSYTKVPLYVDIFGNTGQKINMSMFARDVDTRGSSNPADWRYIPDTEQGWDFEQAFANAARYADVGTCMVAANDRICLLAINDPRIHYIIPFHYSSMKKEHYNALGYQDFHSTENEQAFDRQPFARIHMHEMHTEEGISDAEGTRRYLTLCAERKCYPVFPAFLFKDFRPIDFTRDAKWVEANENVLRNAPQKGSQTWVQRRDDRETKLRLEATNVAKKRWKEMVDSGRIDWDQINPNFFKLKKDYARTDTPFNVVDASKMNARAAMAPLRQILDEGLDKHYQGYADIAQDALDVIRYADELAAKGTPIPLGQLCFIANRNGWDIKSFITGSPIRETHYKRQDALHHFLSDATLDMRYNKALADGNKDEMRNVVSQMAIDRGFDPTWHENAGHFVVHEGAAPKKTKFVYKPMYFRASDGALSTLMSGSAEIVPVNTWVEARHGADPAYGSGDPAIAARAREMGLAQETPAPEGAAGWLTCELPYMRNERLAKGPMREWNQMYCLVEVSDDGPSQGHYGSSSMMRIVKPITVEERQAIMEAAGYPLHPWSRTSTDFDVALGPRKDDFLDNVARDADGLVLSPSERLNVDEARDPRLDNLAEVPQDAARTNAQRNAPPLLYHPNPREANNPRIPSRPRRLDVAGEDAAVEYNRVRDILNGAPAEDVQYINDRFLRSGMALGAHYIREEGSPGGLFAMAPGKNAHRMILGGGRDRTTVFHEMAHGFLQDACNIWMYDQMSRTSGEGGLPMQQLRADLDSVQDLVMPSPAKPITFETVMEANPGRDAAFHLRISEIFDSFERHERAISRITEDLTALCRWAKVDPKDFFATTSDMQNAGSGRGTDAWTRVNNAQRDVHELFARGFSQYMSEGRAPSVELQPVFDKMKIYLHEVAGRVSGLAKDKGWSDLLNDPTLPGGGKGLRLNGAVRDVFAHLLDPGAGLETGPSERSQAIAAGLTDAERRVWESSRPGKLKRPMALGAARTMEAINDAALAASERVSGLDEQLAAQQTRQHVDLFTDRNKLFVDTIKSRLSNDVLAVSDVPKIFRSGIGAERLASADQFAQVRENVANYQIQLALQKARFVDKLDRAFANGMEREAADKWLRQLGVELGPVTFSGAEENAMRAITLLEGGKESPALAFELSRYLVKATHGLGSDENPQTARTTSVC